MGGYSNEFPLLSAFGLYAAEIRGDGNCLFNALSDQIYGDQNRHHEIRARVIEHMRERSDHYKQFLDVYPGGGFRRNPKRKTTGAYSSPVSLERPTQEDVDRVFEQHLQIMARGGTWGDNMEIQAFSSAYGINVKIYQRDFAYMVSGSGPSDRIAHIAYHTWEHYSTIRNIEGPHDGLPGVVVKPLSPAAEQTQLENLQKISPVQPWMINTVLSSLPYLADKTVVKRTLEECRGSVNDAVSKLLDAEDAGSASSTQGSSSIEREPDSDDEFLAAPNKKQDRRRSRSTRHQIHTVYNKRHLAPLDPGSDADGSQGSTGSFESDIFSTASDTRFGQQGSPPTDVEVSSSGIVVESTKGPARIRINPPKPPTPASSSPEKPSKYQPGPKRITARDKKELKKQAQKAARKQRQQADLRQASGDGKRAAGMSLRSGSTTETPPVIESGFRTLFI